MIYCKSQMFDENIYHFSPSDTCNYLYNRTFQQQPSAAFTVTAVQYSGWLSLIGAWIWQPSMKKIYSLIYVAWKYDILVLSAWTNSKHFQLISNHLLHTHWSCSVGTYNALSFYRSQNVLGWSKFFVPDQKIIYILWQSQTFCARQKDDLHSVKLVFVSAQIFLKRL